MKHRTRKYVIGGFLAATLLSGCAALTGPLEGMVAAFDAFEANTTSYVRTEPLETPSLARIAPKRAPDGMSNEKKIAVILAARTVIRTKQEDINDLKEGLKIKIAAIKEKVAIFKEQGLTLTKDDRDWLIAKRIEVQGLRAGVRATIGQVYVPIKELEGQYTLENIDLIYDTFTHAAAAMTIRVALITSFDVIINEVLSFMTLKVG